MRDQKYLLITDLHLENRYQGQLEAQVKAIKKIYKTSDYTGVIIMGDIFMNRRPTPTVLLAFKSILKYFSPSKVFVLRGNHDTETKADDGITALSLFRAKHDSSNEDVEVITHTSRFNLGFYHHATFIPHYEDEELIRDSLQSVPTDDIVFGHFGFLGGYNSFGDADFSITLDKFTNLTFLGHIHGYTEKGLVTVLGTPYSISFNDAGEKKYFGVLTINKDGVGFEKVPITWGPRHLVFDIDDLAANKELINDYAYFTYLRVYINSLTEDSVATSKILKEYSVNALDIKYKSVSDFEAPNTYVPKENLFAITDEVIGEYIDNSNTSLEKDDLLDGLNLLRNENK
tara:strand:- start:1249 stop:2280 length:1032 start_codon:yes stop_codon:yes gene_type:complete